MVTADTDWQPDERQRRLVSAFQDSNYDIDVTEACIVADVPRQTFYNWTHSPDFMRWWNQQRERFWGLRLPRVDAATYKAATEHKAPGSSQDRKTFYERYDDAYQPKEKKTIEAHIDHEVDLQLTFESENGNGNGHA